MKKLFFSICLLVLTGCTAQTDVNDGVNTNWQTLDAGEFQISAPAGWEFIPEMGIDSTVGKFSGGEMTLRFDYGLYSGDFANNSTYFKNPTAYTVTQENINGHEAKIYVPNEVAPDKPTVLFIANPNGVEPCTDEVCVLNQQNFEMLGDNLSEEDLALALQIFRTVDFKPALSGFRELCSAKGGSIEMADDFYCTLDYNGDGRADSSEYCSYSDYSAGKCTLELI